MAHLVAKRGGDYQDSRPAPQAQNVGRQLVARKKVPHHAIGVEESIGIVAQKTGSILSGTSVDRSTS